MHTTVRLAWRRSSPTHSSYHHRKHRIQNTVTAFSQLFRGETHTHTQKKQKKKNKKKTNAINSSIPNTCTVHQNMIRNVIQLCFQYFMQSDEISVQSWLFSPDSFFSYGILFEMVFSSFRLAFMTVGLTKYT